MGQWGLQDMVHCTWLLRFHCSTAKSKQTISGVYLCFSTLKGVSFWSGVISYKFVSKPGVSLYITPTLAAGDVLLHVDISTPTSIRSSQGLSDIRGDKTSARTHKVF